MLTIFYREWRVFALAVGVIVLTGLSSLGTISRQEDPTLTNLFAQILTPYPGAGPERVEALVTEKIENELREIKEIDEITSTSRRGISVVRVSLLETLPDNELEAAWSKIRDALGDAAVNLPPDVPEPEFINDRFGAFTTITSLTFREGATYNPAIISRYADLLVDDLRRLGGTSRAEVYGAGDEEVLVELDPEKLAQTGLNPTDVSSAISAADTKVSAGQVRGSDSDFLLEVKGEIDSINRVREIPLVSQTNGTTLRVGDIAKVSRTVRDPADSYAYSMGERSVLIAARMDDDLRVDAWMEKVNELYNEFRVQLPASLELTTVFDQSKYTIDRLSDLVGNMAAGVSLVVFVLFFTLGWRGALIVALILPMTTLLTISVMQFSGLAIHQMSVSGLIVALGLLVDAAIVMTDDIRRRLKGETPRLASVEQGIKRLAGPLLASTVTTVLAFMPMALLPGPAGDFVGSIALAVIIMLISSFGLALTLTPALAGWLLPKSGAEDSNAWWATGISPKRLGNLFKTSLDWSLRHRGVTLLAAISLPVVGFLAFPTLTAQFFPGVTRDQFYVDVVLDRSASLARTDEIAKRADLILRGETDIDRVDWVVGETAPAFYYNMQANQDGVSSFAQALVTTRDKFITNDVINRLQTRFDQEIPSAQIVVRGLFQGPPVAAPVEVRLVGSDLTTLTSLGEKVRARMTETGYFLHTKAGLVAPEVKYQFELDEDQVRIAGLDLGTVANFLQVALEGRLGGSLLEGTEELPVRVRFSADRRASLDAVRDIEIPLPRNAQGGLQNAGTGQNQQAMTNNGTQQPAPLAYATIPLASLGTLKPIPAETSISRFQGERINLVQGFIPVEILPQDAFESFREQVAANPLELPAGYRLEFAGDADARDNTIGNLATSFGLIITLTIASIVLTFNSFRLSVITFIVAILSMGMSLLSLEVTGFPFGIQALIGVIGSIGVSINAAIIIMTALQQDEDAMAGDVDAVSRIVSESSRHIISTTTTTFGGFLPLILAGGGFWPPFAVAIAGGVLLSTIVSFYFTPPAFLAVITIGRKPKPTIPENIEHLETERVKPLLKAV